MVINLFDFPFFVTSTAIIKTDAASAITPPSFEGTERKITYANRKYHSGWMCRGATSGLAGLKFSTSPNIFGVFEFISIIIVLITAIGIRSFTKNVGLNFILSMFL